MIVMLSAHRGRPRPAGRPFSGRAARRARPVARAAVRAARDTPGRAGQARLIAAFHLCTTIALSVDGVTGQSFFLTHPVDGISAGSHGSEGQSFGIVLSSIPSPRTARAACLHRLSTGLCTERLDAVRWPQKTVSTVL